jgi:hypothetical protein
MENLGDESSQKNESIAIRLNDRNSAYFKPGKELRQGNPLSHLLFNLVADVFIRMLGKVAKKVYIRGLMNSFYLEGVISLQYADDTLLFLDNDKQGACHLKWIMTCFEYVSGMRINYHKSGMTSINLEEDEAQDFAKIFCCNYNRFFSF